MKKKKELDKAPILDVEETVDAATLADLRSGKKCRVILYAIPAQPVEQMFICGEIHSAGEWDATLAKPMKLTDKGWRAIKILPVGSTFAFKVLSDRNWDAVEKGTWREEIPNHVIVAEKGLVVTMPIPTFAK